MRWFLEKIGKGFSKTLFPILFKVFFFLKLIEEPCIFFLKKVIMQTINIIFLF